MTHYLFDVDGTLTPSRCEIDPEFAAWFLEFCRRHTVSLVTGSDLAKTQEQVGADIVDAVVYSFNCSGNAVYQQRQPVYQSSWQCPLDLMAWLERRLVTSEYRHRAGNHIEARTGMVNFSVVGRRATAWDRNHYHRWDQTTGEREVIAAEIERSWPGVQAVIGGEISIDIFRRGTDKSQVLSWIREPVVFFGDRMAPQGNDRPLADAILTNNRGQCYHVTDWKHTWQLLKELV